jgi:Fe2+ or Zn2+ uptake regulation protein
MSITGTLTILARHTDLFSQDVGTDENIPIPPIHMWHACLIRHRLKPSKQRDVILATFARHNHVTAPRLYGLLFREGHRISLGTIYRTLNLFCKMGLAKPLRVYSQTHYEHV